MIDRYLIIFDYNDISPNSSSGHTSNTASVVHSPMQSNPHCIRVASEHSYCCTPAAFQVDRSERVLTMCLRHEPLLPQASEIAQSDYLFSYSCTVLCDGLFLNVVRPYMREAVLEFRVVGSLCFFITKHISTTNIHLKHFI